MSLELPAHLPPHKEGLAGNKGHTEESVAGSQKANPRVNDTCTCYLLLYNELPQNIAMKSNH